MAEVDTDKIDPKKPVTLESLMELWGKAAKGKNTQTSSIVQMVMVAILALGGTGLGQQFFGVSRDTLEKETGAIKAQNSELLRKLESQTNDIGSLKERIVRLETKIEGSK